MQPKVSIVMPNYNYGRFIGQALESVLKQPFSDYEVLVIDDGSTDNTQQVVDSYGPAFGGRLQYIYQKNQGVAVARNTGIRQAKGRYITFIDADDILLENTLDRLVDFAESHPECGLVYGNVQIMDESMSNPIKVRFKAKESTENPYSGRCFDKLFCTENFIPTAGVTIPKHVFEKVGLFDHRFKCGEDLDMWLRISSHFEVMYFDEIISHMRRHDNSLSFASKSRAKADILMSHKLANTLPNFYSFVTDQQVDEKFYKSFYLMGSSLILDGRYKRGRAWLRKAWKIDHGLFKNKIALYFVLSFVPLSGLAQKARKTLHQIRGKRW